MAMRGSVSGVPWLRPVADTAGEKAVASTGAAEVGAVGRALANRQAADRGRHTAVNCSSASMALAARVGVDQNQRHDGLGQPGIMRRLEIGAAVAPPENRRWPAGARSTIIAAAPTSPKHSISLEITPYPVAATIVRPVCCFNWVTAASRSPANWTPV